MLVTMIGFPASVSIITIILLGGRQEINLKLLFNKQLVIFLQTVQDVNSYDTRLTGSNMSFIALHHFLLPSVTFKLKPLKLMSQNILARMCLLTNTES